jgi:hypothetical protein
MAVFYEAVYAQPLDLLQLQNLHEPPLALKGLSPAKREIIA